MHDQSRQYLTDTEARIAQLVFMTAESLQDYPSDGFQDFMDVCDSAVMTKIFPGNGICLEDAIENGTLAEILCCQGYDGFLAEVVFDDYEDFVFDKDNKFVRCSNKASRRIEWLYADSMVTLCRKIKNMADSIYDQAKEQAREKLL